MENALRILLVKMIKEYHKGLIIQPYNDEIINVKFMNPLELNYDDLNNINGSTSFGCYVKGKIPGIAHRLRIYSFSFQNVKAELTDNKISGLNIENMTVHSYERHS